MKAETRKPYETPSLIVLVRGKPEEAVLTACKTESGGIGPETNAHSCDRVVNANCGVCQSRGGGAS